MARTSRPLPVPAPEIEGALSNKPGASHKARPTHGRQQAVEERALVVADRLGVVDDPQVAAVLQLGVRERKRLERLPQLEQGGGGLLARRLLRHVEIVRDVEAVDPGVLVIPLSAPNAAVTGEDRGGADHHQRRQLPFADHVEVERGHAVRQGGVLAVLDRPAELMRGTDHAVRRQGRGDRQLVGRLLGDTDGNTAVKEPVRCRDDVAQDLGDLRKFALFDDEDFLAADCLVCVVDAIRVVRNIRFRRFDWWQPAHHPTYPGFTGGRAFLDYPSLLPSFALARCFSQSWHFACPSVWR